MAEPIPVGTERPCTRCGMTIVFLEGSTPDARIPAQRVKSVYTAVGGRVSKIEIAGQAYVNHFETCPHAEAFTRGKEEFGGKKQRAGPDPAQEELELPAAEKPSE